MAETVQHAWPALPREPAFKVPGTNLVSGAAPDGRHIAGIQRAALPASSFAEPNPQNLQPRQKGQWLIDTAVAAHRHCYHTRPGRYSDNARGQDRGRPDGAPRPGPPSRARAGDLGLPAARPRRSRTTPPRPLREDTDLLKKRELILDRRDFCPLAILAAPDGKAPYLTG